ncbi:MAG: hypothetical protein ACYCOU_08150 [Sulfobacillus sp.]
MIQHRQMKPLTELSLSPTDNFSVVYLTQDGCEPLTVLTEMSNPAIPPEKERWHMINPRRNSFWTVAPNAPEGYVTPGVYPHVINADRDVQLASGLGFDLKRRMLFLPHGIYDCDTGDRLFEVPRPWSQGQEKLVAMANVFYGHLFVFIAREPKFTGSPSNAHNEARRMTPGVESLRRLQIYDLEWRRLIDVDLKEIKFDTIPGSYASWVYLDPTLLIRYNKSSPGSPPDMALLLRLDTGKVFVGGKVTLVSPDLAFIKDSPEDPWRRLELAPTGDQERDTAESSITLEYLQSRGPTAHWAVSADDYRKLTSACGNVADLFMPGESLPLDYRGNHARDYPHMRIPETYFFLGARDQLICKLKERGVDFLVRSVSWDPRSEPGKEVTKYLLQLSPRAPSWEKLKSHFSSEVLALLISR